MIKHIKVSEALKEIGVTAWTLKNWEKLFGWDVPRNERGHRYYTEDLLAQAKAVKNQLNQGLSMQEIMGYPKPGGGESGHVQERQHAHAWGPEY